jgi:ubiquinone/menaquinone biosynthesis C-methylase UbiE
MKSINELAAEMKRDWNERAHENAKWFINTFKTEQTEEEFAASCLNDIQLGVFGLLDALTWRRNPRQLRLLEIGCGIGRMTGHLAEIFGEVHGVDVSGEMVRQGRERLRHLPNVHFHECNGVNFAEFPDDHFDVIFSAYVFQHVPAHEIICANIRDAYRVLAPGGAFRFMANDVNNAEFLSMPKNTWTGAAFSAADSRRLARELGAQLVSLYGEGTQYFWAMFRKPATPQPVSTPLQLLAAGRADDLSLQELPTRGQQAALGLHVTGVPADTVDCNNLSIEWQGRSTQPFFVAPLDDATIEIKAHVPVELAKGRTDVRLRLPDGSTLHTTLDIVPSPIAPPVIIQHGNVADGGLDIYTTGPKSEIRVFAFGFEDAITSANTLIHIGEVALSPTAITFLPANGAWEIKTQLPPGTPPQTTTISLSHHGRLSLAHQMVIQEPLQHD